MPFISKVNKVKRLNFAKEYLEKDFEFWKEVIFTDESIFNIWGSGGKEYGEGQIKQKEKNLQATVKHEGGSVMEWGCMSAKGPGNLYFIEGIMDQNMYLDILKQNLKQSAEKFRLQRSFKFYQDNDPKHKAKRIKNWLLYNCPKELKIYGAI